MTTTQSHKFGTINIVLALETVNRKFCEYCWEKSFKQGNKVKHIDNLVVGEQ